MIAFLGKRAHREDNAGEAKMQKRDTNNRFSALSDFACDEDLIKMHTSSLWNVVNSTEISQEEEANTARPKQKEAVRRESSPLQRSKGYYK
jgi:hypothetical protein